MMGNYYGDGFGFGWFGMLSGWVFTILLWAFVIWVILALVHRATQQPGSERGKGRRAALDILEERYARGEISKEEFEERKSVLSRPD